MEKYMEGMKYIEIKGMVKFRGLCKERIRDGEWVYGYPMQFFDDVHIKELKFKDVLGHEYGGCDYNVYPGTIEMSTGYKDKFGTEIFEGDIVKVNNDKTGTVCYGEYTIFKDNLYICDCLGFYIKFDNDGTQPILDIDIHVHDNKTLKHLEIVSNIHKKPFIEKQERIAMLEGRLKELEQESSSNIKSKIDEIKKLIEEIKYD